MNWDFLLGTLQSRFSDTLTAMYRIVGHHKDRIANQAIELQRSGEKHMNLDFLDPLSPFKEAFGLLLAPKRLSDVDMSGPLMLDYELNGTKLNINSLSSGEKEVYPSYSIFY